MAEPYRAPVSGTPGLKTLKNLLATALEPVGTTLYVYGGSWDWQDSCSANQAMTIGLPQSWIDFFQQQDVDYDFKAEDEEHSYYPFGGWNQYYYTGADCSGYMGWMPYNVMHTADGTVSEEDGYVMGSTSMAGTLASKGWGSLSRNDRGDGAVISGEFRPGDIFSLGGHVWMCVGVCDDGSIVFVHSNPSPNRKGSGQGGGGVQLSALNPQNDTDTDCEAYELVQRYMAEYYPEWNSRYEAGLRSYLQYAAFTDNEKSGRFSWDLHAVLTDPDGYADLGAAEILADLFGEKDAEFSDVAEDAWYADAVRYVCKKGIMSGTSDATFSPDLTASRAMIVTMLYRLAGSPDIEDENWGYAYADVDAESWYGTAVYWARLNGIVSGYSEERFGPADPVSREQFAVMLYRFAQKQGLDVSGEADLSGYADSGKISGYALKAVQWANARGIITGTGASVLSPQAETARAQVAAVFMRFCENTKE